jgi:hypothetical protein
MKSFTRPHHVSNVTGRDFFAHRAVRVSESPTQLTSKKQIIDPVRERLFSIQGRRMVRQARLAMVVIAD